MKEVIKVLLSKDIILNSIDTIDLSLLNTRKKIKIYTGVDKKSNYLSIFYQVKKSRFVQKDVQDFEELYLNLVHLKAHNFKKKILILDAPLCTKAKNLLKEYKWRLIYVNN